MPQTGRVAGRVRRRAHRAAVVTGDRDAEATALTNLRVTQLRQGRHQAAGQNLRDALVRYQRSGNGPR